MLRYFYLILFFFALNNSVAQSVANYGVTRNIGLAFSSIASSGTAVDSWRNNGGFSQDDNRSNFIEIGFDFWYDGTRYTEFCISTNGFIDFSTSTDDGGPVGDAFGYVNSAFSASAVANGTRPAVTPFYDDMMAQGGTDPLGNSIRYQLSGTTPYRVLTVQWTNMCIYGNTTPSLNFQVKLYETIGVIDFHYGTMNAGTNTFSYTCGINAPTMNAAPTAAQLLTQQTANTATFNNNPQNNLSIMPAANSRIRFAPPMPANPSGAMTFSAITQTSMTVNWTNWASNEVGYAVYYSYDAINYFFAGQTAANATNLNVTGLWPGTTYQWRVIAVTEGALSNPLTGTQATTAAGNKVSANSGAWNTPGTWTPVGVPTIGDNVTILNTHTVTIDANANCNNLTIGGGTSGTLRIGNSNTSRSISVLGNIAVNSGGVFNVSTTSNATHTITLQGRIINNGVFDFAPDANSLCNITFNRNSSQSITGTGSLTRFNLMTMNIGSNQTSRLDVSASNLSFPSDFLTINSGTFQYNGTQSFTIPLAAANYTIGQKAGFWLNGPATVNVGGSATMLGNLRVSTGTFNVGNAANENLVSNGGTLQIDGGNLNISGNYFNTNINTLSKFTITGGTLTVPTIASTSTTQAPFLINSPGATFTMTGGTILIRYEGGTGAQDLGYSVSGVSSSNVTGGTLQIGDALTPAGAIININTTVPVGNLLVNRAGITARLNTNPLVVAQNVTVAAGTLNANNLNISLGGNWSDNGVFIPGTNTVTFNGTGAQSISHLTSETFNHLTIAGAGPTTTNVNLTVTGNLNISSSLDVSAANRNILLRGNWVNNGTFIPRAGTVQMAGTIAQTMSGTGAHNFYDLNINNAAGVVITSGSYQISDALFLNAGLFNGNAASSITLTSTSTRTARIAPLVSGSLSGTYTVERFVSARAAGYSDMSAPVTATTFADWDNELLLVYGYSPPFLYPSAYGYSETLWDYVPVTSPTTAINSGTGFEVWLDSDGTYTSFNATTINSKGTPRTGTLNLSSSITRVNDGWNLVGNPYASHVSWDAVFALSTGISGTIMIYDETIGDFATFTNGAGIELAPHQGFWVMATVASPVFRFMESVKTATSTSTYRESEQLFTLKLQQKKAGILFSSNAKFNFISSGTNEVDEGDVLFKKVPHPLAPALFSLTSLHQPLRVNELAANEEEFEIDLGFSVGANGIYTIEAQNLEFLKQSGFQCAVLYDKSTGIKTDLLQTERYEFSATTTEASGRFILRISKNNSGCDREFEPNGNAITFTNADNGIFVNSAMALEAELKIGVYNMAGQLIQTERTVSCTSRTFIPNPEIAGVYFIRTSCNGKMNSWKFVVL